MHEPKCHRTEAVSLCTARGAGNEGWVVYSYILHYIMQMFVFGCFNDVFQNDVLVSAHQPKSKRKKKSKSSRPLNLNVRWFAPFLSGGGYCSEALSYIMELHKYANLAVVQHGETCRLQS